MNLNKLHQNISNAERLDIVMEYPVDKVMSAPGHQTLRAPNAIKSLANQIATSTPPVNFDTPILLGMFTWSYGIDVELRSIECIDGHHRLLAGLLCGKWLQIGDLSTGQVETRVNGCPADSDQPEDRWLPLDVVVRSSIPSSDYAIVQDQRANGPTASISGRISGQDDFFTAADKGVSFAHLLRLCRQH